MASPIKNVQQVAPRDGILSTPSFRYGEERSGAIFGFFHIEAMAITARQESEERKVHRHPDFDQLGILFAGSCAFDHDGQRNEVTAPCCVFTPANVVHRFAYDDDAEGVNISASSDFIAGLSSAEQAAITTMFRLSYQRIIPIVAKESVASIVGVMLDRFASRHAFRCDIMRYLFGGLLLELGAALDVPSDGGVRAVNTIDLFRRYRDLIQATIGIIGFTHDSSLSANTVEFFAEHLSTTPYALNVACQSMCACSARDLIHSAILEQATRLLLYTKRPVKDISFLLGYSHASHFVRFFKQRRGTTPEVFRSSAPRDRWVELQVTS
jgi:AraC family transcriptional regulator, transcriptional activator of pobA